MKHDRAREMMSYVPKYYKDSKYYNIHNDVKGNEFNIIRTLIDDILLQLNPQTSTWGLSLWEELFALPQDTNESIEVRRNKILELSSKIEPITPNAMKKLIKRNAGIDVDIVRNIAPYTFGVFGSIEDNFDITNIKSIIDSNKEAHMDVNYSFNLKSTLYTQEIITLQKIRLKTVFNFWKVNMLNGMYTFESGILMNATRMQHRTKVIISISVENHNSIDMEVNTQAKTIIQTREIMTLKVKTKTVSTVETKNNISVGLNLYSYYQDKEKYINAAVVSQKFFWALDGKYNFDETKKLNATQNKEMI